MASRQLAQAWQVFQAAIFRDASPPGDAHTAAQAVDVPTAAAVPGSAAAIEAAAAPPKADGSVARGVAAPETKAAVKQIDPSDDPDDEEVRYNR